MYRPSYELSASSPSSQETEEMLPAVELQFSYINRDKKRRRYILLDDDPQQALQVHITHTHTLICMHTVLRLTRHHLHFT